MYKLLICGINGKMGAQISALAPKFGFFTACGVDKASPPEHAANYPVYKSLSDVTENIDAVIDFSSPELAEGALCFCAKRKIPFVCGTTALKPDFYKKAKLLAKNFPICADVNFSSAVHAVLRAANLLSESLGGFDKTLIEIHGAQKKDAPGGTALYISKKLGIKYVHSVRGGNAAGEHKIVFLGDGEQIELIHRATDRSVFAKGALLCASRLIEKNAGYFTADDLFK